MSFHLSGSGLGVSLAPIPQCASSSAYGLRGVDSDVVEVEIWRWLCWLCCAMVARLTAVVFSVKEVTRCFDVTVEAVVRRAWVRCGAVYRKWDASCASAMLAHVRWGGGCVASTMKHAMWKCDVGGVSSLRRSGNARAEWCAVQTVDDVDSSASSCAVSLNDVSSQMDSDDMCELREPLMYFDLGTCTYKYSNQQSMVHAQQLAANGIREQQQSAMVQAAASGEQQSAMVQARSRKW